MDNKTNLSSKEITFCDYFVNGTIPFGGDAAKCYLLAFSNRTDNYSDEELNQANMAAAELLSKKEIQDYIEGLTAKAYKHGESLKKFITENLKHIIAEATTAEYRDRKGTRLSPAAMRSVAVSASKTLMELYPIKAPQVSQMNINGSDDSGITFNVIVPESADVSLKNRQSES